VSEKRKYDSTVARIAGNILSGYRSIERVDSHGLPDYSDQKLARWAVNLARFIVAETERTESVAEPRS
jgi:hypothetical protein